MRRLKILFSILLVPMQLTSCDGNGVNYFTNYFLDRTMNITVKLDQQNSIPTEVLG